MLLDVVEEVERVRSSRLSDVGDEIIFMAACLFFSGDEVGDCFPKNYRKKKFNETVIRKITPYEET